MAFEFDFRVDHVQQILHPNPHFQEWYQALCAELPKYDITSVPRVAMFLAQTAHESGGYTMLSENLNLLLVNRLCPRWTRATLLCS